MQNTTNLGDYVTSLAHLAMLYDRFKYHADGVTIASIDTDKIHVYKGIERLAESAGKNIAEIADLDNDDEDYPHLVQFYHCGIRFFQIMDDEQYGRFRRGEECKA